MSSVNHPNENDDLREALAERERTVEELRAALERERQARESAEARDAFKDVFVGVVGHDLRNPLGTILTTVRLMLMQRDLPPESQKKLERVVANGVRIERILDQLFDLTHARLAGGVPVAPTAEQDLVPLVSNVVTEMRVAHPSQGFELRTEPPCVMKVDGDRFQQVVSSLLGNAVSHGDRERPITVAVAGGPDGVTVSVHNHGAPIAPALMPILFDPFKRGRTPRDRRPGSLGLGLYITERIVAAHGGTLVVESSQDSGTTFQASFPRRT